MGGKCNFSFRCFHTLKTRPKYAKYVKLEVYGPSGPQLLVCGPSGRLLALRASLTSSFAPFGRSGRVTHVTFCRQIQKISSTNPKNFVNKSKKFCRQIQKISSTNPKKFRRQIQKISLTNPKN